MILDSSAVIALAFAEPDHEELLKLVSGARWVGMGAPTLVETGIVLSARLGRDSRDLLARFLLELEVNIVPFGEDHFRVALEAWLRFGKGRHPARLNLGDCVAYSTAKLAGQPLLCIGNDFPQTDLDLAR